MSPRVSAACQVTISGGETDVLCKQHESQAGRYMVLFLHFFFSTESLLSFTIITCFALFTTFQLNILVKVTLSNSLFRFGAAALPSRHIFIKCKYYLNSTPFTTSVFKNQYNIRKDSSSPFN